MRPTRVRIHWWTIVNRNSNPGVYTAQQRTGEFSSSRHSASPRNWNRAPTRTPLTNTRLMSTWRRVESSTGCPLEEGSISGEILARFPPASSTFSTPGSTNVILHPRDGIETLRNCQSELRPEGEDWRHLDTRSSPPSDSDALSVYVTSFLCHFFDGNKPPMRQWHPTNICASISVTEDDRWGWKWW